MYFNTLHCIINSRDLQTLYDTIDMVFCDSCTVAIIVLTYSRYLVAYTMKCYLLYTFKCRMAGSSFMAFV